jgi:hypothetical protein
LDKPFGGYRAAGRRRIIDPFMPNQKTSDQPFLRTIAAAVLKITGAVVALGFLYPYVATTVVRAFAGAPPTP